MSNGDERNRYVARKCKQLRLHVKRLEKALKRVKDERNYAYEDAARVAAGWGAQGRAISMQIKAMKHDKKEEAVR